MFLFYLSSCYFLLNNQIVNSQRPGRISGTSELQTCSAEAHLVGPCIAGISGVDVSAVVEGRCAGLACSASDVPIAALLT